MADKKPDPAKPDGASKPEAAAAPAASSAGGGKAAWLPLVATLVSMPVLAYAMTAFVLVPKMHKALGTEAAVTPDEAKPAEKGGDNHGKAAEAEGGHGKSGATPAKAKYVVPLNKMIVNVAGTAGTRYLMTSVTLVGANPDFKSVVEDSKDQLLDLATGALSGKTIADLEKPGARNQIRSELLSMFNTALGENAVKEIYITELAIQ